MLKTEKMLCDYARTLDDRPITLALAPHVTELTRRDLVGAPPEKHVEITKRIAECVDVLGLNYHEPWYPYYTESIDKAIIGTECYEYYSAALYNYEDFEKKNPWRYVLESDNVLGQFIWTGIDYLGESRWPAKGWAASSLDICGFYRDESYLRKSLWSSEPVVHLCFYDNTQKRNYARGRWSYPATVSHLNLDHLERRIVLAAIYTNCEEVELWINDKKLGRRKSADYENGIIEWTFDYAKGEAKVIGYKGGKAVCVQEMKTAGPPEHISLKADKTELKADSGDLAHVELTVTDNTGCPFPAEDLLLGFALEGDGQILGASSPDIANNLGFDLPRVYCSQGKALVIIKAGASAGELVLTAFSDTLKAGTLKFMVR
jgi:beta-galactosidase